MGSFRCVPERGSVKWEQIPPGEYLAGSFQKGGEVGVFGVKVGAVNSPSDVTAKEYFWDERSGLLGVQWEA